MQYFYGANQIIDKMASGHSKLLTQKAFYDTMGGYLKYFMIPTSKYSFYAGLVKLKTVDNILCLHAECKKAINTNGNGWRAPLSDFTDLEILIEPLMIIINENEEDTSCIQLDMLDEHAGESDDMLVALPRLDPEEKGLLGNIWLPFKRKRTFNLQSCMSAFVLMRYFEVTTRCYAFQGVCQDTFNKMFKEWILENLEIHLGDDVLYPGLGAILRVIETLRKNKGIVMNPKTDTKRHKTQNYRVLENKAKKMNRQQSPDWIRLIFGNNQSDIDNGEEEPAEDNLDNQDENSHRMMFIYIAVAVALGLLLFVIILAFIIRRQRNKNSSEKDKQPPKDKKKMSLCQRLQGKKDDDEEVLLSPDSSSIASGHKSRSSSSVFSCFSKKSPKSKKDPKRDKDSKKGNKDAKNDNDAKKDKDSKNGKDTMKDKDKDSSKNDDPKKNPSKRDSLSKKDSSSSKKDAPLKKDSKKDNSDSSSPPQSPKCFTLCSSKQASASSMDSESGNESKKRSSKSPSNNSGPGATSTPKSKVGTVNEKKRFSISKKNKDKSISFPPENAHVKMEAW